MEEIAIKNIYYIALYVWGDIKNKDNIAGRELEAIEDINDVIIDLFVYELERLTRKGLYGEYRENDFEEEIIKGKINIARSIYLTRPKISCRYDEFTRDNIYNRLLKAILLRVYYLDGLDRRIRKRLRFLLTQFNDIGDINLEERTFKLDYNRGNIDYRLAIDLGYFIYKNSIALDRAGKFKFFEVDRDNELMSNLFEKFLMNFYKVHTDLKVKASKYSWNLEPVGDSNIDFIPGMETDVELESDKEKIIIDAKYYRNAFQNRFGLDRFISSHIYQMSSYLNINQESLGKEKNLRGILVYPSNGYDFSERFKSSHGYQLEFRTVNLNREWKDIERELLSFID